MKIQEKFEIALRKQIERFEKQDEEKRILKKKIKKYVSRGIPKILAISFAKHGLPPEH